ncbi:hypothetical protein N9Z79_06975 [Akkermansiaceae bacterium]|nr:hypothetical protein [bacterium]MDB4383817.1 hypothetical protein [Akkermansiaceae bacterium]
MISKNGLFAAAWAVSCGAAFLIGRGSSDSPGTTGNLDFQKNTVASRSAPRGQQSVDPSKPSGRVASSSTGTSSSRQIEAIREEAKALKNMSDPIARAEKFLEFVKNLSPDQYLAAVDSYREGGIENEQFGEYRMLLSAWAQVDPLQALDYAKENTGTNFARQTILSAWAKNDTEGAVAWARDNFDSEAKGADANPWLVGVIEGISSLDLGRATQLLEELPFSRGRGQALDAVFAEVTASGPENAKRWIASLSDEKLKSGAAGRLAGQLAKEDPRAAAEWATSMGPEILKSSAGEIVQQWADNDLPAALSWVESQPEEIVASAGPSLVREMIQNENVVAASDWLANYEGNPAFDDSVKSLVWHSMGDEPALAADWIMRLSTEDDQRNTFHRMIGRWMSKDEAGVVDYVNNNPVPEGIKQRVEMTLRRKNQK